MLPLRCLCLSSPFTGYPLSLRYMFPSHSFPILSCSMFTVDFLNLICIGGDQLGLLLDLSVLWYNLLLHSGHLFFFCCHYTTPPFRIDFSQYDSGSGSQSMVESNISSSQLALPNRVGALSSSRWVGQTVHRRKSLSYTYLWDLAWSNFLAFGAQTPA